MPGWYGFRSRHISNWRAIDEAAIRRGFSEVVWPGRFDVVSQAPLVILDCAHNELSVEALLETVDIELGPGVRPWLVFACLQDKRYERMAGLLAPRVREANTHAVLSGPSL